MQNHQNRWALNSGVSLNSTFLPNCINPMKINRRIKCLLISLVIILNLILRYPATPHEIGWDSYEIHIAANSISTFGCIKWWLDPTCLFGFHPYSYDSSVPLLLSGISQGTSINMEWTIWLFSTIIGIFSAFNAYLMAEAIYNDDLFKILTSLIYSTLCGVLNFTTWTVSTRGLFIALLPLFIFVLLKTQISVVKHLILLLLLFLLLAATHHLFYYLFIPLTAYLIVKVYFKLNNLMVYFSSTPKIPNLVRSLFLILSLLIMPINPLSTSLFPIHESIYTWLNSQFMEYFRNIGVLIIFMFGCIGYLIAKGNKTFEELFLITTFIGITPFFGFDTYTKWFILPFAVLLIGIGLKNSIESIICKGNKYTILVLILFLTSAITFASYIQFLYNLNDPNIYTRYMTEETYSEALWIKDKINEPLFGNDITTSHRLFSVSEVPTFTGTNFNDLAYGFVKPEDMNITLESFLSPKFYINNPYISNNPDTFWYLYSIHKSSITEKDNNAQKWIKKFNLSYFMENRDMPDIFTISIVGTENIIYDSGKMRLWKLNDRYELNI